MYHKLLFLSFITCAIFIARAAGEHADEQIKVGNFAVIGTMQPLPLFGFGQAIIDKNEAIAGCFFAYLAGKNKTRAEAFPYFLYAPRDDLSIFLAFPIAMKFKQDNHTSSGSEDLFIQSEYAFYTNDTPTFTNQMTLVTAVSLPTGNVCKKPSIGFGSPAFFVGVTAKHLATEWYCYTSYAALFTTKYDSSKFGNSKFGNQFFYQAGFGKNIGYSPNKWILMWMVEMYGVYEQKSKINGIFDQNSGSNFIAIGPSLWFSTERIFLQAGIGPVVTQHHFGEQSKNSFFAAIDSGVRF